MIRKIINALWVLLAVALIAIVVVFVSISKGWIGYMPPVEELENPNYKFATEVFSEDGKVLGTFSMEKNNRDVYKRQVGDHYRKRLCRKVEQLGVDHFRTDPVFFADCIFTAAA